MANGSVGMSGPNFDAFVSSQRSYNEPDWAAKIQEKYWRARQKFLAKIEKKEDSCIILSDSKLDSKLEIYHSIDRSCARLTDILESYQNCLFVFANEENALGILLKECAKHDTTKAGKIMALTGKSLTQSSHQRIRLYMPILRLYQEMETFHSRAVNDTSETVAKLESKRSQYRSSLLWMKDLSEKLDPDVYKQLDKFRRVQNKVRDDKSSFDSMQMDVVQKIDLLMASRCNLINQTLATYQAILLETFEKNQNNFRSVEEIIRSEDLYEYEFKTLKQLNPLKISDDSPNQEQVEPVADEVEAPCHDLLQDVGGEINNNIIKSEDQALIGENATAGRLIDTLDDYEDTEPQIGRAPDSTESLEDQSDLLDSLFGYPQRNGPSEGSNESKSGKPQEVEHKKRQATLKTLRSNLNTDLLCEIDSCNEDKQVKSLLGISEQINSSSHDDLFGLCQEDIFAKWVKDLKSTTDKVNETTEKSTNHYSGNMSTSNMDQDLMDLGSGQMPKSSDGLEDFLA